jgi:hypothetical protein
MGLRNFPELLRVIDSLQLGDKYKVSPNPPSTILDLRGEKELRK